MRRLCSTWALLLMVSLGGGLGACGGGSKASDEPLAKKQHVDGPPPAAPAADSRLSAAECTRLFEHIVKLLQEGLPPDQWEAGKQDLAAERETMIKDCQDGDVTRAQLECMLRATRLSDISECVPQGS